MSTRTLAFSPVAETASLTKGDPETFIDLDFVPIAAETWDMNQPGAGCLRLYGDGSVELLEHTADGVSGGFKLTPADWQHLQEGIEPGYW